MISPFNEQRDTSANGLAEVQPDGSQKIQAKPAPIGLCAADAAALLGVSESHFYCLLKTGRLGPKPVRMGRAVRWSRQELIDWFNAGSPPRNRWEIIRHQKKQSI